jgi:hypothetical protein
MAVGSFTYTGLIAGLKTRTPPESEGRNLGSPYWYKEEMTLLVLQGKRADCRTARPVIDQFKQICRRRRHQPRRPMLAI